ncbi:hypothetical protein ACMD2_26677, partial [Ananas comosus]
TEEGTKEGVSSSRRCFFPHRLQHLFSHLGSVVPSSSSFPTEAALPYEPTSSATLTRPPRTSWTRNTPSPSCSRVPGSSSPFLRLRRHDHGRAWDEGERFKKGQRRIGGHGDGGAFQESKLGANNGSLNRQSDVSFKYIMVTICGEIYQIFLYQKRLI